MTLTFEVKQKTNRAFEDTFLRLSMKGGQPSGSRNDMLCLERPIQLEIKGNSEGIGTVWHRKGKLNTDIIKVIIEDL